METGGEGRESWLLRIARAVAVAGLYYILGRIGIFFTLKPDLVTVFWPATGFLLAALLVTGKREWPLILSAVFVTNCIVNYLHRPQLGLTLGYAGTNVVAGLLDAWLLHRFCGVPSFNKLRDVLGLVVVSMLLASTLGAALGAATAAIFAGGPFLGTFGVWMISDTTGILLVTPLLLALVPRKGEPRAPMDARRWIEAAVLLVGFSGVCHLVFGQASDAHQARLPLMYVVFPFVLWAAVRFDVLGTSITTLVLALFAVLNARAGRGPQFFGPGSVASTVYWLQIFLIVVGLSGLLLAAAWGERTSALRAVEESEARLSRTEEMSLVMATHVDVDGRFRKVPRSLCALLGYAEEELLGKTPLQVLHPEDVASDEAERARLLRGEGSSFASEKRYLCKDGRAVWVDVNHSLVTDATGAPIHFLTYLRDVTERKRAEAELVEANQALMAEVEERRRAEEIIARQARELVEVSTPIVTIHQGMVLAPLVGSFDRRRAEELMRKLLDRVEQDGSEVVLLDITGVPEIDAETARHLLNAIDAAKLLGARSILTGVRPAIARTLVQLDIDLSGIATRTTLAAGLQHALEGLGRRRGPALRGS
jgi:PAS domain S-box-containing protein